MAEEIIGNGGNRLVRTLNHMGNSTTEPDALTLRFIADAVATAGPVLDVGAAFGVATLPVIAGGGSVIANDVDPRHLAHIEAAVPLDRRHRLTIVPGVFPVDLEFEPEALAGALLGKVLHFLTADEVVHGLRLLRRWLRPGARVYATVWTPYTANLRAFVPEFLRRRAAGDPWPGLVARMTDYAPHYDPAFPQRMLLFDLPELRRTFMDAGFEEEWSGYLARPELPTAIRLDGREAVGIICQRP